MDTLQLSLLDVTLGGTVPIIPAGAGGRKAAKGARQAAANSPRQYFISPARQGEIADADLRDSNADVVGGSAVITITSLDAGQNDFTNDLSIYSCPQLTNVKDSIAICSGLKIDSIATVGTHLSRVDSVRFVLFTTPRSGTAAYGSGGTVLGTVYPDQTTGQAVLKNLTTILMNNTPAIVRQYIYTLVYPIPENPACRQSDETTIKISPALSATAVGGALTCAITSATLTGQALYGDGTPAMSTSITFAWAGPGSFTSNQQNPVVTVAGDYTLTVGDGTCPSSMSTGIAAVTSDTAIPAMTASVTVAKSCETCAATLTAVTSATAVSWTGPNGFIATGATGQAVEPGEYTVTAIGLNGCTASAKVPVTAFQCPDPACLPIIINRLK